MSTTRIAIAPVWTLQPYRTPVRPNHGRLPGDWRRALWPARYWALHRCPGFACLALRLTWQLSLWFHRTFKDAEALPCVRASRAALTTALEVV
jgi:hypothetical protein